MHGGISITTAIQEIISADTYWDTLYLFNNSDATIYLGFFANPGTASWTFVDSADPDDAGVAGQFAFDAVQGSESTAWERITKVYINRTDSGTTLRSFDLGQVRAGHSMTIAHSGISYTFRVDAVTSNADYFTFTVKPQSAISAPFDDGLSCTISLPNLAVTSSTGFPLASGAQMTVIRNDGKFREPAKFAGGVQAIHASSGNKNLRYAIP